MEPALVLRKVSKAFGSVDAVRDLDLVIPRGTLCGVIGPNGAGKTTTLRMIMSILFPDSGELSVLGQASALAAKDRIGYLPEERGVYRKMRVGAFLTYIARLKGVADAVSAKRIAGLLERLGIAGTENKRCEEMSKGMQQKVQLIAAIVNEPELLILDEPFSGLDPLSARSLRELVLAEHRRGATILFSTHVMAHAEELCEHVVMIHRGHKVLDDTIPTILRRYNPRVIQFEPFEPGADLSPLAALVEVESMTAIDRGYQIRLRDGVDPAEALRRIPALVTPARLELSRQRLEDVFLECVGAESASTTTASARRERERVS